MEKETIITESGLTLRVEKTLLDSMVECEICTESLPVCILHWGTRKRGDASWQAPPQDSWPEGSRSFSEQAVQSPFVGRGCVTIRLRNAEDLRSIDFVLFFPNENRWDNNRGKNYRIELPGQSSPYEALLSDRGLADIAGEIIDHETSRNSWTLMHRFNLCYDLLDKAKDTHDGLAIIFVWLRYSFIRQLDWQRNYNTKPRELGHAMDRLTLKLAGIFCEIPAAREMIRLILTTLGRGSDAQRVRDEVLNIMHRHHIKEVSGHFMEEWHQKLHNNTTPDDVVICEAYLEFLRSYGNLERFYQVLQAGGVTKERLEGYERPIRSHPDFIPHLRDALIGDFEHFLGILRAVHAGTDLGTAIQAARYIFDNDMHRMMDYIWHHHNDGKISTVELSEKITEARRRLSRLLCGHQEKVRDLLFLDIALEDFLRIVLEKHLGPGQDPEELVDLLGSTIENLTLSDADEELLFIRKHWRRLEELPRFSGEWSLHAKAVADRMAAAVGDVVDRLVGLIQPKAEFLGEAFHADSWAIRLFSEEVLRGRPIFALSRVLRFLDPVLRKSCHMGNWQVISPGETIAEVEMAETLRSVQGRSFSRPVLLVTERVSGDEEIPVGVTAIVTPEVIDILAHLSVRARNSGVLFATCFDADLITRLHSLRGRLVKAGIQGGDVVVEESAGGEKLAVIMQTPARRVPTVPHFTAHAITIREFAEASVGGKSNHLKQLQGKLPDWVVLPASVAIPFGVFENLLREKVNADTAADFDLLLSRLEGEEGEVPAILSLLQETILRLDAPEMIVSALRKTFGESGLPWPADWNGAWTCIKKVWASKWNERAYLSRRASNIPDRDLFMAVLIQAVIEAEYSYVIHTVNPFNGARGEIYAEAVKGLGEALVGNYPGRAFSFSYHKSDGETKAISFPSKRKGLFGKGLIFRSDSNGEDLAEFAGAGLYDSFILPLPRKITVDYTTDPLIWNDSFRKEFSSRVGEIGALVEQTLGVPQDIEGVYSKGRYYVVQTRPQVGIRDDSRP